jgi:uncharacterized protein (TIGR01777 family)
MPPMNVLVSGASGLIGTALRHHLVSLGHGVVRLVRGAPARDASEVAWDPDAGAIDSARLVGIDAVANLAGAGIARWPWTSAHKRRVLESRVHSTALLARTVSNLAQRPRVFVSASAIGFYGNRGDAILREDSPQGSGFLAEVCAAWESAAAEAARSSTRVATLRIGMVLSGLGGALPALVRPFRLGLGGPLGDGRQYMSWIALEDLVGAITHAIVRDELGGPINAVAPHAVTNAEFTRTLGRVLRRPTLLPAPAFALRLMLGEMADELLLASARGEPARLLASGFAFRYPTLEGALRVSLREAAPGGVVS